MAEESAAQFSRKAGDFVTFLINYNFKGVPDLHLQKLENICNTPQKQNSMIDLTFVPGSCPTAVSDPP